MEKIDFSKYPKVFKYVKDSIDKPYFKPFEYNPIDEETFISVVSEWIDKFENDIDNMVDNTYLIYGITKEETGYKALSFNWEKRRERRTIDKDLIRQWWTEKFRSCICQFYQSMIYSKNLKAQGGATGCLITCSFTVRLLDSDYKRVKYNVVSDFNMSLNIGNSLHTEIDLHDNS